MRLIEPWNRTHLYTCGTGAYKPICTFINRGWRAEVHAQTQTHTRAHSTCLPTQHLSPMSSLYRITSSDWCQDMWTQEKANAPMTLARPMLLLSSVRPPLNSGLSICPIVCAIFTVLDTVNHVVILLLVQMGTCMQGSMLISWAQTLPSSEPWEIDQLSGLSNMIPDG